MLKKYYVRLSLFVVLSAVFFLVSAQTGGDMSLTLEDGREVQLHENNTWSFTRSRSATLDEDMYITLRDNRILALKMDNTWAFVKSIPKVRQTRTWEEVTAVGRVKRPTLDQAVNDARVEAINRAASSLKSYASKTIKDSQKIIAACINQEIGPHGAEVSYEPGWTAEAKVTLSPRNVRRVIECLDVQIAPPPEEEEKQEDSE